MRTKITLWIVVSIILSIAVNFILSDIFKPEEYKANANNRFWLTRYEYVTLVNVGPKIGKFEVGVYTFEQPVLKCMTTNSEIKLTKTDEWKTGQREPYYVTVNLPVENCLDLELTSKETVQFTLYEGSDAIAYVHTKPNIQSMMTTGFYIAAWLIPATLYFFFTKGALWQRVFKKKKNEIVQ